MKKIKKACGKGGAGIANLASAAVKTVVSASLSMPEKQTLRDFRGEDAKTPASVPSESAKVYINQEVPVYIHLQNEAAAQAQPPSYEAAVNGAAHHHE